jgi:hypothetical protein
MSAVPILSAEEGHCVTPISISDVRFVLQTKDFPLSGACLIDGWIFSGVVLALQAPLWAFALGHCLVLGVFVRAPQSC